ncbi:peptide chain release factor N(5)-glutamine methyltransferase [Alphaproteobacteria bacterium]|jgi:release factor glutamine methyltransferase|nr:peptide chain release factor N(5)-glutamine methyltransferase [Alphaproteobacteria bacterium]
MNDFIISNLKKLKYKNIPNAEIDLRILLNYSRYSKNEIILSNFDLDQINIDLFNKVLNRRLSNEPISKIINKKNFWKDGFYVNEFVLDPRPETEGIVEESIKLIKNKNSSIKILDIGTGSGALAISLAREFNNANIMAIDISEEAIKVANINIYNKKLNNQIQLRKTTIDNINEKFDLIVSNPPYLTKKELENTSYEIKNYEPLIALDGGEDGLNFYRDFSKKINKIMNSNSYLLLEIGEGQFRDCIDIFSLSKLNFHKKAQDLQKKDRILIYSKL